MSSTIAAPMHAWVIMDFTVGRQLLADSRLSKDAKTLPDVIAKHVVEPCASIQYPEHMLFSDPPTHTRLRRLLGRSFGIPQVQQMRTWIEKLTDDLLDSIEPGAEFDVVETISAPLSIAVIGRLLGIDEERFDEFRRLNAIVASVDAPMDAKRTAYGHIVQTMAGLIEAKRVNAADDLATRLIESADGDEDATTEAELVATLLLIANAGYETTANMISSSVLALIEHPDQRESLRADPGLIPRAVEEFLRYESPLNFTTIRYAKEPIAIGDEVIAADDIVFVSLCGANHDAEKFPEPHVLDIKRDQGSHVAFGHGVHHCLGAPLARLEGEIILHKLVERFPEWELACAKSELAWRASLHMRGLARLPVQLR
ncbi:cytochrome P450 family protein [Nocardia lijiangensis]|uniref:cytochrome P450 family protein n=1 Tax=Nocardia lijiangensis TaxID=299618 RepID=UPI0013901F63|nr:cytochrome P450 [Nocardia lijiangensis]